MAARTQLFFKGATRRPVFSLRSPKIMPSRKSKTLTGLAMGLLARPLSSLSRAAKAGKKMRIAGPTPLPYVYDYFGIDRRELLESGRYPKEGAEARMLDGFIKAATIYLEGAEKHLAAGDAKVIANTQNLYNLLSLGIPIARQRQRALLARVDELIKKEARAAGALGKRGKALSGRAWLKARHRCKPAPDFSSGGLLNSATFCLHRSSSERPSRRLSSADSSAATAR